MGISGYYSYESYATKRIVRMMSYLDKRQPDFAFPPADPLFLTLGVLKVYDLFKLKIAIIHLTV